MTPESAASRGPRGATHSCIATGPNQQAAGRRARAALLGRGGSLAVAMAAGQDVDSESSRRHGRPAAGPPAAGGKDIESLQYSTRVR